MTDRIILKAVIIISVVLALSMVFLRLTEKPEPPTKEELELIVQNLKDTINRNVAELTAKAEKPITDDKPATDSENYDALRLCSVVHDTDRRVRCKVYREKKTIKLRMNAEKWEAQKICNGVVLKTGGIFYLKGWVITLVTPTLEEPLAHCYPN